MTLDILMKEMTIEEDQVVETKEVQVSAAMEWDEEMAE